MLDALLGPIATGFIFAFMFYISIVGIYSGVMRTPRNAKPDDWGPELAFSCALMLVCTVISALWLLER